MVEPVVVSDLQTALEKILTEPVEFASKITSSALVGADAPPAPPEDVDQPVVDELFHALPVGPTQYLVAIAYPYA
jgi:hypothetical protein